MPNYMIATPVHGSKPMHFCICLGQHPESTSTNYLSVNCRVQEFMDNFTARDPMNHGICQPCLITGKQDLYAPCIHSNMSVTNAQLTPS